MVMSAEEFEYTMVLLYKPVIAERFREIEKLLAELGEAAVNDGADPEEVAAILEDARFNKDGWWD